MKLLRPGDAAPKSGIYDQLGPRGGHTGKQVVAEEGEPLPPTPRRGMAYELAVKAKHAHHET